MNNLHLTPTPDGVILRFDTLSLTLDYTQTRRLLSALYLALQEHAPTASQASATSDPHLHAPTPWRPTRDPGARIDPRSTQAAEQLDPPDYYRSVKDR